MRSLLLLLPLLMGRGILPLTDAVVGAWRRWVGAFRGLEEEGQIGGFAASPNDSPRVI